MPLAPASRVNALSGEGAFEVLAAARRLEAAGRDVVHLEIGEPDGAAPPHVIEAGVRALHDGHTRYVDPAGLPALRAAISAASASSKSSACCASAASRRPMDALKVRATHTLPGVP